MGNNEIKGFWWCHSCGGKFEKIRVLHDGGRRVDLDDYDDAYLCPLCGAEDDFEWENT